MDIHTKECFAKALICAVENLRDWGAISAESFQKGTIPHASIFDMAHDYLLYGDVPCTCKK